MSNRRRSYGRALVVLIPATFRLIPWWHLPIGAALAAGVVGTTWRDRWHTVPAAVDTLRLAMLPIALSVAFVLDDPTEDTLSACPVPVSARTAVRLMLVLPVAAGLWAGLVAFASSAPAFQPDPALMEVGAAAAGVAGAMGGFRLPVGRWLWNSQPGRRGPVNDRG